MAQDTLYIAESAEAAAPAQWSAQFVWFIAASLLLHAFAAALMLNLTHADRQTPSPYQIIRLIELPRQSTAGIPSTARPTPSPETARSNSPLPAAPVPAPEAEAVLKASADSQPSAARAVEPVVPLSPDTLSRIGTRQLLDDGVVETVARAPRIEREAQAPSRITFGTDDYKYSGYMRTLKERIEGIWAYPREAVDKNIYGDLYITFIIKKDGSLGSVELERTSGYAMLDQAAIKALREAAPFWPLPEWWEEDALTVPGHFIYTLSGTRLK